MSDINNIRNQRKAKGLSQQAIANQLGVDRTTYIEWEKHSRSIPSNMLIQMSGILEVSCDYLLNQTDVTNDIEDIVIGKKLGLSPNSIANLKHSADIARDLKPYDISSDEAKDFNYHAGARAIDFLLSDSRKRDDGADLISLIAAYLDIDLRFPVKDDRIVFESIAGSGFSIPNDSDAAAGAILSMIVQRFMEYRQELRNKKV